MSSRSWCIRDENGVTARVQAACVGMSERAISAADQEIEVSAETQRETDRSSDGVARLAADVAQGPAGSAAVDPLARAAALIESAPVAIYHADDAGNLTYANPEYRRLFGLKPHQSTNDWAQGVHPDDRARMEAEWADFCANPRPMQFDYRTTPRAGTVRHLAERIVRMDRAPGFIGTISDFTELMQARGNLQRIETLFRNTFEAAPIGVAFVDRQNNVSHCNKAFAKLLSYRQADLIGRSVVDLTSSEDVARATTELKRLWSGEVAFADFEKRYRRKDGSVLWVQTTKALVPEAERAPGRLVEFIRDISARKAMSVQLEEHKTLLETVLANLPLALIACDADGRVTHYNREAAEMCTMPRPESVPGTSAGYPVAAGIYLADGVTPVDRADRPLARTLRGETVQNLELVIVAQGGPARVTLSNGRRLVGPNGRTMGAVVVTQDITQRRRAELELERVQEQLRSAARQAGMAEVATNVLHNVGNILTSINVSATLLADLLRRSKASDLCQLAALLQTQGAQLAQFVTDDERGRLIPEYLEALGEQLVKDTNSALEHVTSLRENLEHIKRTVAMQQNYAKLTCINESVNVIDLIEDSLRLNASAFTRDGIELRREFNPVPPITVDKHKVLQILVNLVRNAKWACDESGRKDKVLTLRVENHGNAVRISVIDNGVGIASENMGRLFTHGFTTRRSGHGFGLHSGAIAAQELGGSLGAESEGPGRGATFILELPQAPAEASNA